MKVGELIHILSQYDENANVILGIQPSYPFEHRIRGVVTRRDFIEPEPEDYEDRLDPGEFEGDSFTTDGKIDDVIICEGGQIRYGDKDMFEACSRC